MTAFANICSDTSSVEQAFREAMIARGLLPPRVLVIGRPARCPTTEKPRGQDGGYLLHLDTPVNGKICHYADGGGWQKWVPDGPRQTIDPAIVRARQLEREKAKAGDAAAARLRALGIWEACTNIGADRHPYLERKGLRSAHGARLGRHGMLVVPAYDTAGELQTLQFIGADGMKRFLRGGQKRGASCLVGLPGVHVLIAEGFATACSLTEATGMPCLVAFDAGNLGPVAIALRKTMPRAHITVCGDDDWKTDGNPGWAMAARAARAVGGELRLPGPWPANRGQKDTDFNDLARLCGPRAVVAAVLGGAR